MVTREYDFDAGVETASAPTISAPVIPGDVVTLGAKTSFTIANNTGPSNVTSLVYDKTVYRMFMITYSILRSASGGKTRSEAGILIAVTDGTNWECTWQSANCPNSDTAGVVFSITSAGQIQYTSDDNGGSYLAANSVLNYELLQLMGV